MSPGRIAPTNRSAIVIVSGLKTPYSTELVDMMKTIHQQVRLKLEMVG